MERIKLGIWVRLDEMIEKTEREMRVKSVSMESMVAL